MTRWATAVLLGAFLAELGGSAARTTYERLHRTSDESDDSEIMVTRCLMCKGGAMVEVKPHVEQGD